MNADKVNAIVRTILVFDALRQEQGSYRLGEISQWSKVSRSSCDRYLRALVDMKVLDMSVRKYKGSPCRFFSITDTGREFASILSI